MPTPPQPTLAALAPLSNTDLVKRFAIGIEHFNPGLLKLDDRALDTAFRPEAGVGRWPVRVLVGHLADAELGFIHRLRRIAAEEHPLLQPWDENAFIDAGLYGTPETGPCYPVGAFIATIHTLRKWTAEWLATLPDAAFARKGLHAVNGEQTLRTILEYDTWHLEHHAWFLNRKLERLASH